MCIRDRCKGADDREGIRKGTKICLLLSIIMTIVISVLALLCGAALFRVFIKEKAVIELGCRIDVYKRQVRSLSTFMTVPAMA